MKPPGFDYIRVASVDEAVATLADLGDEAKVLAGGQSLVPLMNFRLASPGTLVDINDLGELAYLHESDGYISIGALTRHRAIETATLPTELQILSEAALHVGHLPIRIRGTFGGSIAHADPSAEFPLLVLTLAARMIARSSRGERVIPASEFFIMPLVSALEPDELLTEIQIARPANGTRWAFQEFARRAGDFGIVSVAALVQMDTDGICSRVRVGLSGVAPTPVMSPAAESALMNERLIDSAIQSAAAAVAGEFEPTGDIHGSSEYRSHLASVLLTRALQSIASPTNDREGANT